ncbi:MAG: hypothetical protein KC435_08020 [Thermomicrobiales bacterium]|nr:hypothetical protein [Thermomicrobiales bacterium]
MTDSADTFQWHPDYAGRTIESVQREISENLRRDQLAYQNALNNAEREEFGAFATIRDLERKWSQYDMSWAEVDSTMLAERIVAFEHARDTRQELFSWQEWKANLEPLPVSGAKSDWRENMSDEQRRKVASAIAMGVIVLSLIVVLIALSLIF